MTPEELKQLLATPAALFLIMLLGSLASALKQISDAKKNGTDTTLGSYLGHWPETLGTLITNALGFATLVVTDQLNFASALGIGYAANSAADLLRSGGRSASLTKQGGFARVGMLVILAVMASVFLAGCTINPDGGRELSNTGRVAISELSGIAISRFTRESPRAAEKIQNIRNIAARLQAVTDETTIVGLRAAVNAELDKLSLSDLDRQDATRFLNILQALLTDYVGEGELDGQAIIKVNEFLDIVVGALPATTTT